MVDFRSLSRGASITGTPRYSDKTNHRETLISYCTILWDIPSLSPRRHYPPTPPHRPCALTSIDVLFFLVLWRMFRDVRPWLDLVDELRAHGISQDLPLPQIAVMGDQSCGKSSVLEVGPCSVDRADHKER